uniref:Uncharacterized protein n=1 Tax=Ciona intestinalis TaxID=7719 RepID=H2XYL1_CIOIN
YGCRLSILTSTSLYRFVTSPRFLEQCFRFRTSRLLKLTNSCATVFIGKHCSYSSSTHLQETFIFHRSTAQPAKALTKSLVTLETLFNILIINRNLTHELQNAWRRPHSNNKDLNSCDVVGLGAHRLMLDPTRFNLMLLFASVTSSRTIVGSILFMF